MMSLFSNTVKRNSSGSNTITVDTTNTNSATAIKNTNTNNTANTIHYPVVPKSNHGPYKEYSVIHTDRSLNLMSAPFGTVMRDLNRVLKHTYHADAVVILPGCVLTLTNERNVCVCVCVSSAVPLLEGWFLF